MNGGANRRRGHDFERAMARRWREAGWVKTTTSRYSSKEKDDQCIDLCGTEPFQCQMKAVARPLNYHAEIAKMAGGDRFFNLIFHKRRGKVSVVMDVDDFFELAKLVKDHGVV